MSEIAVMAERVSFEYAQGATVLDEVDVAVASGESVAIMGRSGSGKSTLLSCLAGLNVPTSGSVLISGERLDRLSVSKRARLRLRAMGFVMQFGELIPELTVGENIGLPLQLLGKSPSQVRRAVEQQAERLGIAALLDRFVWQVSGGEMQRAAIARAVVHDPEVVFADEPTGALDGEAAEVVIDLVTGLAADGKAVVVVTHDSDVASRCNRVVRLVGGRVCDPVVGRLA